MWPSAVLTNYLFKPNFPKIHASFSIIMVSLDSHSQNTFCFLLQESGLNQPNEGKRTTPLFDFDINKIIPTGLRKVAN